MDTEQAIQTVLEGCGQSKTWYEGYMRSNIPRIVLDARFILKNIEDGASVLDIGAIPPLLVELLCRNGIRQCAVADPHADIFHSSFEKSQFAWYVTDLTQDVNDQIAEAFDFVCMNEVIEHLAGNLVFALENVVRTVKPGGTLMITTPNLRSINGLLAIFIKSSGLASKPLDSVREQYERADGESGYFGHVREYTPREVIELVESFGMRFTKICYQRNCLHRGRLFKAAGYVERICPPLRLFAKYLFKKLS